MYCPQCGNESTGGVQFCRTCGANLKVIGKAVALSEAIARSDRGPMPKIKEMVKSLKVEHVTEEVSKALDKMNTEIASIASESQSKSSQPFINLGRKKTPAERREQHISKGIVSLFSGIGMTVFLYYLSAAIVLKLPPDVLSQIPFELEPVIHIIWLFGLVPTLAGLGHIIAGLLISKERPAQMTGFAPVSFAEQTAEPSKAREPRSVTEHTTELLSGSTMRE